MLPSWRFMCVFTCLWTPSICERPEEQEEVSQVHHRGRPEQRSLVLDADKENVSHRATAIGGSTKHVHQKLHKVGSAAVDSSRRSSGQWTAPKPTWKDKPIPGSQHWKKKGWFSGSDRSSICFGNYAYPCGENQCCCAIGYEHSGFGDAKGQDTCFFAGGPSYTRNTSSSSGGPNQDVLKYMIPRSKDKNFHFCHKKKGIESNSHECGEEKDPGCCCNGGYDYNLDLHKCEPSEDHEFDAQFQRENSGQGDDEDQHAANEERKEKAKTKIVQEPPQEPMLPKSGVSSPFWRVSCRAMGFGIFALTIASEL